MSHTLQASTPAGELTVTPEVVVLFAACVCVCAGFCAVPEEVPYFLLLRLTA
jgi:hypothetical protein